MLTLKIFLLVLLKSLMWRDQVFQVLAAEKEAKKVHLPSQATSSATISSTTSTSNIIETTTTSHT